MLTSHSDYIFIQTKKPFRKRRESFWEKIGEFPEKTFSCGYNNIKLYKMKKLKIKRIYFETDECDLHVIK